jgi:predicted ABC-type ATPase
MYILPNGESISEEDIQSLADEKGISFYEVINEIKIKELPGSDDNSILENTGQFFVDKAAALVSATSSLGAGLFDLTEGLIENGALAYMNASDYFTDDDYTDEDRKNISKKIEDEFVMDSNFTELAEIADSYRTKYDKDMFDSFGEGDYLAGTDQVMSGVVGAIPSIAATMYGGWAGLIGLGISEAGATYEELSEAKTDERGLAMFGNALAQGTIEAASEAAMRGTFGWLGKVAGVKTAAKEISSRIVFGALSEGISETSAGEFNNYLDGFYTESKFYDKDGNLDIKNISKRIGETMLISGIVGGGMTSIGEISAGRKKLVISNLTPADYSNKNVENSRDLIEKTAERKNFINNGLDPLTIDKEIAKIKEKINYNNNTVEEVVSTYTREEIIEQLSIKGEITDLETQIKNTNVNELSKKSLQKELDKKKEQQNVFFNDKKQQLQKKQQEVKYNNAFKDVEKIKEDFDKIKDKSIYSKEAEKQLIKNVKKVEVTPESINKKAKEIYVKEKLSEKYDQATYNTKQYIKEKYKDELDVLEIPDGIKPGTPEFDSIIKEYNDQLDAQENDFIKNEKNPEKLAEKRKEIKDRKEDFKKGLIEGQIEGTFVNGVKGYNNGKSKIIVSKDNSIKNGKISTLAHEVLHYEMYSKFGNDASQNEKGESLLNYLSKNEKSIYDQVIFRLESSYTKRDAAGELLLDADGNRVKENDYYLEAFNAMSDIISFNPEFKKNKTLLNKIKEFINDLIGRDVIKDGKDVGEDVFDFITNYNKSVVFGRGNKTNIEASKTIDKKVNKDKTEELDNRVTPSKLSKSNFPNLLNNTAYKEFQESLKGITLYHGGNKTIDELKKSKNDNWATWWYAGSPYGSMQYAGMASEENLDSDGFDLNYNQETRQPKYKGGKLGPYKKMTTELYKEKYSPRDQMYELEFDNIKDAIIIPDVEVFEDFSYFLYNEDIESFQETFKKGSKAQPSDLSLYSYGDVVGILDLPAEKAEAILIQYMDYIKKYDENYTDFFGGNKKGKLDTYDFKNNPVPLTVIGKINSNLIEKTESKQDDFVFIDEVYKEYDKETSSTKFSKTDLVSDINKLVPSSATKDSWRKGDLFDAYSEMTEGNLLNGLIGSKLEPGDNVYGKPKADITREIKEEVGLRLMNFDPENEAGLAGYLLGGGKTRGIVDYAVLDVIKKYKKEAKIKTTSIDRTFAGKDGDEMSMDIEDTSINETVEERKQREKEIKEVIVGRKGFQGETRIPLKDAITFKDQDISGTFAKELGIILDKIKIPVSDTKSFIFKLKEELTGRQYYTDEKGKTKQRVAVTDFWNEVRKNADWSNKANYEEFLLTNKKALLNGLTTTYLSKAFPATIEKFVITGKDADGDVAGSFTTDWSPKQKVGKKPGDIDFIRSVNDVSQLEGDRTGRQRMRRLPNADKVISDEQWIGQYKEGTKPWPQMKNEPLWREIAGEIGYETFQAELSKFDDLIDAIDKVNNSDLISSEKISKINEIKNSDKFRIISKFHDQQAILGDVITEREIAQITNKLERGIIKYSKTTKETLYFLNEVSELDRTSPEILNNFNELLDLLSNDERKYYDNNIAGTLVNPDNAIGLTINTKLDEEKIKIGAINSLNNIDDLVSLIKKISKYEVKARDKEINKIKDEFQKEYIKEFLNNITVKEGVQVKGIVFEQLHNEFVKSLKEKKYNFTVNGEQYYATIESISGKNINDHGSDLVYETKIYSIKGELIDTITTNNELKSSAKDIMKSISANVIVGEKGKIDIESNSIENKGLIEKIALEKINNIENINKYLNGDEITIQVQFKEENPPKYLSVKKYETIGGQRWATINRTEGSAWRDRKGGVLEDHIGSRGVIVGNKSKEDAYNELKELGLTKAVDFNSKEIGGKKAGLLFIKGLIAKGDTSLIIGDKILNIKEVISNVLNGKLKFSFRLRFSQGGSRTSNKNEVRSVNFKVIANLTSSVKTSTFKFGEKFLLESVFKSEKLSKTVGLPMEPSLVGGVKFSRSKVIFMAGSAGSGKSSVISKIVNDLNLSKLGFKIVNQDPYLEKLKKENNLPDDESSYDAEQRSLRAKLGWVARKAADSDFETFSNDKNGLIIDGTGGSAKALAKKIEALKSKGYDASMIYVETSKENVLKRNAARSERSLPEFIVDKNWESVNANKEVFREQFLDRFALINTDNLGLNDSLPNGFVEQVKSNIKYSVTKENLSDSFNNIIQQNKKVDAATKYSDSLAKLNGATVGRYKFFVPPSADDFMGLMYSFLGKGKVGDEQKEFFEQSLNGPYKRGISKIESEKQRIEDAYSAVTKKFPEITKLLGKKIPGTKYTYDQAIRVHLWKTGPFDFKKIIENIGLSGAEVNMLNKVVTDNSRMQQFARGVAKSTGLAEGFIEPGDYWLVDSIVSDLSRVVDKIGRKKYLNEFIENSKVIFSKENLNKIEAIYGSNFREALEDSLFRMINGTNKNFGNNRLVDRYTQWLNNSVGAIMFLNMRSAALQTISAANFINWSDNNLLNAGKALLNTKQFLADFTTLFNSDKLRQRRKGLKTDINQAELASSVADSKNKIKALLNFILKKGFTPTQLADSFAIAVGGASMYRNRINTYLKQGLTEQDAQKKAFEDFSAIAEESQQSSDPSLVSQQQSGPLGRLILAFQNTPMQYNRLIKKAALDLANNRGDWKTNISKIAYYGFIQNLIFSTLQSALFAMAFDNDDDESKEEKINKKEIRIMNGMLDTILRGSGLAGAAVATLKNAAYKYYEQEKKEMFADHTFTILELANFSPPLGKKLRNVYSSILTNKYEKDVIAEKGWSIDSPIYKVIGGLTSAGLNVPLDRVVNKANNVAAALDTNNTKMQRILLGLGWSSWDLNIENEEHDLIKTNAKDARRKEGYKKSSATRNKNASKRTIQKRTIQRRTIN